MRIKKWVLIDVDNCGNYSFVDPKQYDEIPDDPNISHVYPVSEDDLHRLKRYSSFAAKEQILLDEIRKRGVHIDDFAE